MLEYSFSIIKYKGREQRILRTKGDKVDFKKDTYQTFTFENEDVKIIYKCKIEELIKEDADQDNFYSWFIVSDYSELIDKSPKYEREFEKANARIDFLLMMTDLLPEDDNDEQNVWEN